MYRACDIHHILISDEQLTFRPLRTPIRFSSNSRWDPKRGPCGSKGEEGLTRCAEKAAESDSDVAEMLKFEKSAESEGGDAEGHDKSSETDSSDDITRLQETVFN